MAIAPWSFSELPMHLFAPTRLTIDTTSQNDSSDSLSSANISPPISSSSLSFSSDSYYHGSTSSLPLRRKRSFSDTFSDTVSGVGMTRASSSYKRTRDGRRRAISMDDALWPPVRAQIISSSPSLSIPAHMPLASSSSSPSSSSSFSPHGFSNTRHKSSTSTTYTCSSAHSHSPPPSPVLLLSDFMQLDPDDVPFAKSGPGTIGMWFPPSVGMDMDADAGADVASDESECFSSDEGESEDEVEMEMEAGYESGRGGISFVENLGTITHRPIKWDSGWDAEDETAVQHTTTAEEDFDPPMHTKLSPSSSPPATTSTSESSIPIPYEVIHGPQTATWYRVPEDSDADADSNTPGYVSFEPMSVTLIDVSSDEGRERRTALPRPECACLSVRDRRMESVTGKEKAWRGMGRDASVGEIV